MNDKQRHLLWPMFREAYQRKVIASGGGPDLSADSFERWCRGHDVFEKDTLRAVIALLVERLEPGLPDPEEYPDDEQMKQILRTQFYKYCDENGVYTRPEERVAQFENRWNRFESDESTSFETPVLTAALKASQARMNPVPLVEEYTPGNDASLDRAKEILESINRPLIFPSSPYGPNALDALLARIAIRAGAAKGLLIGPSEEEESSDDPISAARDMLSEVCVMIDESCAPAMVLSVPKDRD